MLRATRWQACASAAAWMAVSAALASPTPKDATAGKGQPYIKMKRVQVMDSAVANGKSLVVLELLIPADWKFQSDVRLANRGCFTDFAAVTFRASSPDGRVVIEAFPSFSWQFASDPAVQRYLAAENQKGARVGLAVCPVGPWIPAADLLRKRIVALYRPGKQIASVEPMPDVDQLMKSRMRALEQQAARTGQPLQFRGDAARARLKYDLGGQPVEEWVTVMSVAQARAIATGSGTTQGVDCRATMIFAMRAPQDQLDANENLFQMVTGTLRPGQEWQRLYLALVSKASAAQQAHRQMEGEMLRQFQQQEIKTIQSVVANSQQGANQAFAGTDQLIRGVESYRNPSTGATYELSNLYGHAWVNGSNEYVVSDDPNFNPQSALSGSWTALEHVQPTP